MKTLKTYLIINSMFSFLSGFFMIFFSGTLSEFFNITNTANLFYSIGLILIVFASFVWYVSAKQLQSVLLVKLISFSDILWVAGSLIIVGFQLFDLSQKGYSLITVVAIWIAFLAYKQLKKQPLQT